MTPRRNERTAVLVDRHPLWLDAAEQLVVQAGLSVVAKTTSSLAALDLLDKLQPDLLITEMEMQEGDVDGIALLRCARARLPGLRVAILAAREDMQHVDAALSVGADVYIFKTAAPQEICAAISQAAAPVADAATLQRVAPTSWTQPAAVSPLSQREMQIVELMAEGKTAADAAERILWMTEEAVASHLAIIRSALDGRGTVAASPPDPALDRWARDGALQAAM